MASNSNCIFNSIANKVLPHGQRLLAFLFIVASVSHADPTDKLAARMIKLRKDVELLNEQYELKKADLFNQLKGYSAQKVELEASLSSEENRKKQLNGKITEVKKQLRAGAFLESDLKPILISQTTQLKKYIEDSLPVKTSERLQSVESIEDRLNKNEISSVKAANLLWSVIEDEKRLAKENSVMKQKITLEGKEYLADTLKLGMVRLYYKIGSGSVGYVTRQPQAKGKREGQWSFIKVNDADQVQKIESLFASFKKQLRQGLFEIPL